MDAVIRSYEAKVDDVLPGERSVVARINTDHVDRYKTVIDPLGGQTSNYNRNGPVLWNHGKDAVRGSVPIGKGWVKVRQTERDLIGKTKFAADEFSQQIFEMYQDDTLRGWSVNILPSEASPPTREEIRARPELADCEMIYRRWDLAEFSAVAVPGNADALTLIVSRGLMIPDDARALYEARAAAIYDKVLDLGPRPEPPPPQETRSAPYIDADGLTVRDVDGRALAIYSDPADAEVSLKLMLAARPGQPDGYVRTLMQLMAEQRSHTESKIEDMIARFELEMFSRV